MKNKLLVFLLFICFIFVTFSSCTDTEPRESSGLLSSAVRSSVEDKDELYQEVSRLQQEMKSEISRAEEAAREFQEASRIQSENEEAENQKNE